MTSRIGVYGGMFDPVHNGHIKAASFAASLLDLDQVRLIPCAVPNHRDPATARSEQRVRMLELATSGRPKLCVDQRELQRTGVSYTTDTLRSLSEEFSARTLVFILGLDAFNSIPHWHNWPELFELAHLLVLNRRGGKLDAAVCEQLGYEERSVPEPLQLFNCETGGIYFAWDFDIDLSSSAVRDRLRANEETARMLDGKVSLYIDDNKLYR